MRESTFRARLSARVVAGLALELVAAVSHGAPRRSTEPTRLDGRSASPRDPAPHLAPLLDARRSRKVNWKEAIHTHDDAVLLRDHLRIVDPDGDEKPLRSSAHGKLVLNANGLWFRDKQASATSVW